MALLIRPRSPYYWVDIQPADGPRVRLSTKIRHDAPTPDLRKENKRLAERVMHEAYLKLARRRHGEAEPEPAPVTTFKDFAGWYEAHVTPHKRGSSREREIVAQLTKRFGPLDLRAVDRQAVQEWITERRKTVTASTVNREVDVLKHLLAAAVPKYLPESPIARLKRLRTAPTSTAVLSPANEKKLLAVLEPADQAIVIAAIDTLMRASDLLRLEWRHDHGTYLEVVDPKTARPYKVPVSKRLRVALDERKAATKGKGFVFAHRRVAKDPRSWTNSLKQMFEDACTRANVRYGRKKKGVTFHALRHTGATRLIEAGVSLRIVQAIGGWSDLRLLTRYTHPSEAAMQAAVDQIAPSSVTPDGNTPPLTAPPGVKTRTPRRRPGEAKRA